MSTIFKAKNVDITGGPLIRSILLFSLPVMLGSLIQVLFNAADLMVLGQMTEDEYATAAVGATSSIVGLLVTSVVGLSAGVSVVLARCLGRGDEIRTRRVLNTAVITSFCIGIAVCIVCLFVSRPLLMVTDCPEECLEDAVLYMRIYAFGIPAILVYNFGSAIIRTTGDTQKPLYYLILAGITNVVLNFVLCILLTKKVAAVAVATSASQLLGAILVMIHLVRLKGACNFSFKRLSFSFNEFVIMMKIGVPCGLNSALFSLSNLQIQSAVNSFGPAATAGGAASGSIEGMVSSFGSFAPAALPFVGQNIGAEKRKRVRDSIIWCCILAATISLAVSSVLYIFADQALALYLPNSLEAVEFAKVRMLYVLMPFAICAVYNVLVSAMQAFGYSLIPMINSIVTVLGFRLVWMEFIYPVLDAANRSIHNIYMIYTISWSLCLVAHLVAFVIIYRRYKKGRTRNV